MTHAEWVARCRRFIQAFQGYSEREPGEWERELIAAKRWMELLEDDNRSLVEVDELVRELGSDARGSCALDLWMHVRGWRWELAEPGRQFRG